MNDEHDEHDEHDLIDYLFDNLIFDFWSTVYYSRSTTPDTRKEIQPKSSQASRHVFSCGRSSSRSYNLG